MNIHMISHEARKAIRVGYENHWRFRVVGSGEVPPEPIYKQEWVYVPTQVPEMGHDRLKALQASGIRFKGFVIAHEAPRLLSAPASTAKKPIPTSSGILPDANQIVENLLLGALYVLSLIFRVVLLDPALIVVLEDGTWLEVMTWYE